MTVEEIIETIIDVAMNVPVKKKKEKEEDGTSKNS